MHGAVLADFSWCLHVRKRTYPSPSDLGNSQPACVHKFQTRGRRRYLAVKNPSERRTGRKLPLRIRTSKSILSQASAIEKSSEGPPDLRFGGRMDGSFPV